MVSSISGSTNVDDKGINHWEKTVTDVNDVDEKFSNARDLGYMRLNYARVSAIGNLAKYDTQDIYKIQVQSNGKLTIGLRSGSESDDESVLDLSEYQQKLDELKKQTDPEGYAKEQAEKKKKEEAYGLLGANGEGLQMQVYMKKNGKEVLIGDTTADKDSKEYANMEKILNGEYRAKQGDYYIKISRSDEVDSREEVPYLLQVKQGDSYKHDYMTTEQVSEDTKNKKKSTVPMTNVGGTLSAVNALQIQAQRYQTAAQMLQVGYMNMADIYNNNSKF
ncbi:MAG: hypothetical protein Q4F75_03205 [Pseudomonadota bacterium]|nr:hypothetical protein [Pseudomonadota bacterium]